MNADYINKAAQTIEPKVSNQVLTKDEILNRLEKEITWCQKETGYESVIEGIKLAVSFVNNQETGFNGKVLKLFIVTVLQEIAKVYSKFEMKETALGINHAWLMIEHMEGDNI